MPNRTELIARHAVLTLAVLVGCLSASPAAVAAAQDCRAAVEAAFAKQRATKGFRMESETKSPQGPTRMRIDYQMPDRMYQRVEAPGHAAPVETIAIAKWAWGTMGGGWEELQPQFAQSITAHLRETLVNPPPITVAFTCLGKVALDGKDYLGYRTEAAPAAAAGAGAGAPALARTVYVDEATGLPMRNVVARLDGGEPPVFDGHYSYPDDLKIEAPIGDPDPVAGKN